MGIGGLTVLVSRKASDNSCFNGTMKEGNSSKCLHNLERSHPRKLAAHVKDLEQKQVHPKGVDHRKQAEDCDE